MKLFERIARGSTDKTQNHHLNAVERSEIEGAILANDDIPPEQKEEALKLACELTVESKKNSKPGKSELAVPVAVAAVVAAMAFNSNEAHANNPITRRMAKFFADQLVKPIADGFNSMFEALLEPWFNSAEEASTASITSYASMADGANHLKRTTYNEEIMREQAPDPQECELDATCTEQIASEADEAMRTINTTIALDISAMEADGNTRGQDFRQQIDDDIASGGDGTGPVDTSILYSSQGYDEQKQNDQAFNVLKNISGSAKNTTTRAHSQLLRETDEAAADRADVSRASRMARRSVVNYVLAEQVARRNNTSSSGGARRSRARIEKDEVSRNFTGSATHSGSGAGYRDQIRGFTKPAPLLRQLNLQQGQTNYLLLQELEELKKTSALLGVQVLEMTDRRGTM